MPSGYSLSNGMKINFRGEVTPASYGSDEYYVDGVGDAIRLIQASEVEITADYTTEIEVPFDSQNFDRVCLVSTQVLLPKRLCCIASPIEILE